MVSTKLMLLRNSKLPFKEKDDTQLVMQSDGWSDGEQPHPGKQQQIAEWFEQETGRHLAQGKISEILGSKYEHLDADNRKDAALHSQRRSVAEIIRPVDWGT